MQEKTDKPLRRVKQIAVTGLFGIFNHVIPLYMYERITIIHGPNGFGKTAILRLLNALFSKDDDILRETVFDELRVDFDDNTSLWVKKILEQGVQEDTKEQHSISQTSPTLVFETNNKKPVTIQQKNLSLTEQLFSILKQTSGSFTNEQTTATYLNSYKLLSDKNNSEWLIELRKAIPVHFIETQRLLNIIKFQIHNNDKKPEMTPTITAYSEELAEIITIKLAQSSALSQTLDKTFPVRAFSPPSTHRNMRDNELREKLATLEEKRSQLTNVGLLDADESATFQIEDHMDDSKRTMLSVYVEDTEKKLNVYEELASKIDLLTKIINKRFLYKNMTTSKDKGFIFTNSQGVTLPLESLSSGEQHELVLFYELLFKVAPNSLVLIDEPEISLHVVWQEHFLKDIQEVTRLAGSDVLMATHSPDVISNRWDLTVPLNTPSK